MVLISIKEALVKAKLKCKFFSSLICLISCLGFKLVLVLIDVLYMFRLDVISATSDIGNFDLLIFCNLISL